jgi:glucose-1-phosphate adenylyltransferase
VEGRVENSILFPGVCVEKGAEVRNSILFFDSYVKAGARLNRAITDIRVQIGRNCAVGGIEQTERSELAVIGTKAVLADGMCIPAGGRVLPHATVV